MAFLEPRHLRKSLLTETSFDFEVDTGVDNDRRRWYVLRPHGLVADHTFAIRITIDWRRIRIAFEPGKFAAELLSDMRCADDTSRAAFRAILAGCQERGADIEFWVNGVLYPFQSEEPWAQDWRRLFLYLSKGQLDLGTEDGDPDADIICRWAGRFTSAITAILPFEEEEDIQDPETRGYPEGAVNTIKVNRFERDRRNRAAAIAIHGSACLACGLEMKERYGGVAEGFIEIHHVTPVSEIGVNYVIDPAKDLVPLCPNCHAIAHRRTPPFSVEEIRQLIKIAD